MRKRDKERDLRLVKSILVFVIAVVLSILYFALNKPEDIGLVISREDGGQKDYHVTWGQEEFDLSLRYKGYGEEESEVSDVLSSGTKSKKEELSDYIRSLEKESRGEESFSLPEEYQGQPISYEATEDKRPYLIGLIGAVVAVYLYIQPDKKKEEEERKRQEEIRLNYPEFISVLNIFLQCGMSLRLALKKMNEEAIFEGQALGYELKRLCQRMENGLPLGEALKEFSISCNIREIKRTVGILLQNKDKGSVGLSETLMLDVSESENLRLRMAKEAGEKASAKMLLPITMLLLVVVVILMGPAFLQLAN